MSKAPHHSVFDPLPSPHHQQVSRPLARWATLIGLWVLVTTAGCDSEIAQNRFVGTQVTNEQFAGTDYFDQITTSDKLVIVDFTATWCGPCQQLKPLLQELEAAGRCKLIMIDADEHPAILEQFRVNGIPHLLFIKEGQIRDVHRGSASRSQLDGILQGI